MNIKTFPSNLTADDMDVKLHKQSLLSTGRLQIVLDHAGHYYHGTAWCPASGWLHHHLPLIPWRRYCLPPSRWEHRCLTLAAHKCNPCDFASSHASNMRKHMRMHSEEGTACDPAGGSSVASQLELTLAGRSCCIITNATRPMPIKTSI